MNTHVTLDMTYSTHTEQAIAEHAERTRMLLYSYVVQYVSNM